HRLSARARSAGQGPGRRIPHRDTIRPAQLHRAWRPLHPAGERAMIRHVTVLGFCKALGTSLTIPVEMLYAADTIARIRGLSSPRLEIRLCSPDGADIPLTAGLELRCDTPLEAVQDTDLIIIP